MVRIPRVPSEDSWQDYWLRPRQAHFESPRFLAHRACLSWRRMRRRFLRRQRAPAGAGEWEQRVFVRTVTQLSQRRPGLGVPVAAQFQREDEAEFESLDSNQVLEKLDSAGNRFNTSSATPAATIRSPGRFAPPRRGWRRRMRRSAQKADPARDLDWLSAEFTFAKGWCAWRNYNFMFI
jgi:hypothetical protein